MPAPVVAPDYSAYVGRSVRPRVKMSGAVKADYVKSAKVPDRSLKTRTVLHCKDRPDSKRARLGAGGSKRFVPWCS